MWTHLVFVQASLSLQCECGLFLLLLLSRFCVLQRMRRAQLTDQLDSLLLSCKVKFPAASSYFPAEILTDFEYKHAPSNIMF